MRYVRGIVVEAKQDFIGSIILRPVNNRWARRFAKHVEQWTGNYEEWALIQSNVEEFIEADIPLRHQKDLRNGYSVRFVVDPWIVGHWYGWDAHEA